MKHHSLNLDTSILWDIFQRCSVQKSNLNSLFDFGDPNSITQDFFNFPDNEIIFS